MHDTYLDVTMCSLCICDLVIPSIHCVVYYSAISMYV